VLRPLGLSFGKHPRSFGPGTRTRVAFAGPDEDAEEVASATQRFSPPDIRSGLPDGSRETDEREVERRVSDLRVR
jgi:hypothetical protein